MLPPDFTQENFAVGWYTSTGTFVGDMPSYPQRVTEFSNSLAKIIPDYRKVSEGPTKVNSMDAMNSGGKVFRRALSAGDLNLGRVIFLPTEGTTGATLTMLCTSLAGSYRQWKMWAREASRQ